MLIDIDYSSHRNNCLRRPIKNAGFNRPEGTYLKYQLLYWVQVTRVKLTGFLLINISEN